MCRKSWIWLGLKISVEKEFRLKDKNDGGAAKLAFEVEATLRVKGLECRWIFNWDCSINIQMGGSIQSRPMQQSSE